MTRTISSLQIGHTSLELAEAAAEGPCSSSATLEEISSVSVEADVLGV